jgi:hypothetical protein
MSTWSRVLAVVLLLGTGSGLRTTRLQAQAVPVTSTQTGTLSVFIDCERGCDTQYIRTEIAYVNWVRDRTAADVHVLITEQDAGGGGEAFTLAFIGQRAFAGRGDTLTYTTNATTTSDEERQGLTRTLALGLVQYVARTAGAQSLLVSTRPDIPANAPGRDYAIDDPRRGVRDRRVRT